MNIPVVPHTIFKARSLVGPTKMRLKDSYEARHHERDAIVTWHRLLCTTDFSATVSMASRSRHWKQFKPIQTATNVKKPPTLLAHTSGISRPTLLSYENTAEWHQGNELIRHGYRPESNSTRKCFASWLYVHNETVNIYSHLLPAAFFLIAEGIMYQHFRVGYPQATAGDRLIFAFFLLTAATYLGISATYHTLMNHSIHVSSVWLRLDWVGIVILIFGDSVSGIYMGLYCEPKLQRINWSMVQVFIIVGHMLLIGIPYRSSRWVLVRLSYYLIPRFKAIVAVLSMPALLSALVSQASCQSPTALRFSAFSQLRRQSGVMRYIGEGLLELLGVFFYIVSTMISNLGIFSG